MRFLKTGAFLAGLLAFSAVAPAEERAFGTGLYLGINAGGQWGSTEVDLNHPVPGSIVNIDGLSSRGALYGVHGGFDFRPAGTSFVFGVMASHQWGEQEHDISVLGTSIINAAIEPTWKAGGRIGYVLPGEKAMVYGGYQWAHADMEVSSPLFKTISRELDGHNLFLGLEVSLAQHLTFGVQYDRTTFDTENLLPAAAAPLRLDVDTEVHAVTGRLTFRPPSLFGQ